jgi:hypothetical protein
MKGGKGPSRMSTCPGSHPPKIHPFPRGVATARMCRQARGRNRCHGHGALQLRSPGLGSGGAGGPRRHIDQGRLTVNA